MIGAGLALLVEWAIDLRREVPVRRSGSFGGIIITLAVFGFCASGWTHWGPGSWNWNGNDSDFFNSFGQPEHDNDQKLLSAAIPGNASIEIDNPRGELSIPGAMEACRGAGSGSGLCQFGYGSKEDLRCRSAASDRQWKLRAGASLTFWYTRKHRAKMVTVFMTGIPVSSVVASPISGWIMKNMTGMGHMAGWQWLFLAGGIPSVMAGLVTLLYLPDSPLQSAWLSQEEKDLVAPRLEDQVMEDVKKQAGGGQHNVAHVFRSPRIWMMCGVYFATVMGSYGLTFWLPQVISETLTTDPQKIGWIRCCPLAQPRWR